MPAAKDVSDLADLMVWRVAQHGGKDSLKDVAAAYYYSMTRCPAVVNHELGNRLNKMLREAGYKSPKKNIWWDDLDPPHSQDSSRG